MGFSILSVKNFNALLVLAAISIVIFGIALRFYHLEKIGLWGSDTVYYTTLAESWADGDRVYSVGNGAPVYRPIIFVIYSTALKVFGKTDFAIKFTNALVDSINILLIFLICFVMFQKNLQPALAATSIYALLPQAILLARTELVHTLSAFFVLTSFFAFFVAFAATDRSIRCILFGVSGISSGLSVLTHEELLFIVMGYALLMIILVLSEFRNVRRLRMRLVEFTVFLGSFFLITFYWLYLHLKHTFSTIQQEVVRSLNNDLPYFKKCLMFLWNGILANTSPVFLCCFILAVLVMIVTAFRHAKHHNGFEKVGIENFLIVVVVTAYITLYGFFLNTFFPRVFYPVLPLMIILIVFWFMKAGVEFRIQYTGPFLLFLALLIVLYNFDYYNSLVKPFGRRYSKEWARLSFDPLPDAKNNFIAFKKEIISPYFPRIIYDEMKNRVSENSRLLIASSLMYPYQGRRPLQTGIYFGDNVIYVIDHDEPLDVLIEQKAIKYVLLTGFHSTHRLLKLKTFAKYEYAGKWRKKSPLVLGRSYGFDYGEFTVEREVQYLKKYLDDRKAKVLVAAGRYIDGIPEQTQGDTDFIIYEL